MPYLWMLSWIIDLFSSPRLSNASMHSIFSFNFSISQASAMAEEMASSNVLIMVLCTATGIASLDCLNRPNHGPLPCKFRAIHYRFYFVSQFYPHDFGSLLAHGYMVFLVSSHCHTLIIQVFIPRFIVSRTQLLLLSTLSPAFHSTPKNIFSWPYNMISVALALMIAKIIWNLQHALCTFMNMHSQVLIETKIYNQPPL